MQTNKLGYDTIIHRKQAIESKVNVTVCLSILANSSLWQSAKIKFDNSKNQTVSPLNK